LTAVFCNPICAVAGQEAGARQSRAATVQPTVGLIDLSPRAVSHLFQQQGTSADRQVWAQNLAQAKARHRRSTWFLVGAAGLVGLGIINQATEEEGYTYVTTAGVSPAVFFYIFGGGLGAYGFYERTRSQREIQELEAEGRRRGFAFAISPKGVAIGYAIAF
jgi:hypothetical protein